MLTMQDHLSTATSEVLRDLGRNEAADRTWRKASIKILMEKNHPYANHPDFRELRNEIKEEEAARHEVESLVAQTIEEPVVKREVVPDKEPPKQAEEEPSGPFKASFTTKSM
jgi:hypothetical protein